MWRFCEERHRQAYTEVDYRWVILRHFFAQPIQNAGAVHTEDKRPNILEIPRHSFFQCRLRCQIRTLLGNKIPLGLDKIWFLRFINKKRRRIELSNISQLDRRTFSLKRFIVAILAVKEMICCVVQCLKSCKTFNRKTDTFGILAMCEVPGSEHSVSADGKIWRQI